MTSCLFERSRPLGVQAPRWRGLAPQSPRAGTTAASVCTSAGAALVQMGIHGFGETSQRVSYTRGRRHHRSHHGWLHKAMERQRETRRSRCTTRSARAAKMWSKQTNNEHMWVSRGTHASCGTHARKPTTLYFVPRRNPRRRGQGRISNYNSRRRRHGTRTRSQASPDARHPCRP